jgi:1-deoxy-D-xylulose-5-phosphate reductoisomerase
MSKQIISILGSTGSVGVSTLDVILRHPQQFTVEALTAHQNVALLFEQCQLVRPRVAVMADEASACELQKQLINAGITETQVLAGAPEIERVAADESIDSVMSAIVGAAGLLPTLAAVKAGKRVLIANKEPLVMTGALFMQEAKKSGAIILPIDSEHNAVFQCLPADQSMHAIRKIHLTASGGPFRGQKWTSLADITPAQACAHPNWEMGRKISVDSATMMNKGLELIEASALFSMPANRVEVIVHPQSIIHSLVEYCDGSFLAQLGAPDMRIPIAHALSWPERIESGAATLSLTDIARLDFSAPDLPNLPCLRLAQEAALAGGSAPAILNAANEIAVAGFLDGRIRFTDIPVLIEHTLANISAAVVTTVADLLNIDNEARNTAIAKLNSISGS